MPHHNRPKRQIGPEEEAKRQVAGLSGHQRWQLHKALENYAAEELESAIIGAGGILCKERLAEVIAQAMKGVDSCDRMDRMVREREQQGAR